MKAAQISQFGDPSVVQVVEVETPIVKDGYVLIKAQATSLNPFDTAMRTGKVPFDLPATLGGDIAGIVEAVGADVNNMAVGDKVYGQANILAGNSGAFAEYVLTKQDQVAKMPSNLDFVQAASLALVGVSALQALTEHINLQSGQKVLIQGGSGGIGTVAVQIAKHIGAYVATTVAPDAVETVKELGADEVIDYKAENFEDVIHDYDAVFDAVGGDTFAKSLNVLKPGGIAVSMIAQPDEDLAKEKGVTALAQQTQVTTAKLNQLTELIESGAVTPHISKTFPLDQIVEAFEAREGGSFTGKIALEI